MSDCHKWDGRLFHTCIPVQENFRHHNCCVYMEWCISWWQTSESGDVCLRRRGECHQPDTPWHGQRFPGHFRGPTVCERVLCIMCVFLLQCLKPMSQLWFDYNMTTIRRYHDAFDYDGSDRNYNLHSIRRRHDYDTTTMKNWRFIFCSRRIASNGSRCMRYIIVIL